MMFFTFLLSSMIAWAQDCNTDSSKVLCEVAWSSNSKLKLITPDAGCEFPEGAKRKCAILVVCQGNEKTDSGASVLFGNTDFNLFCQTPSPMDLLESKIKKGPSAFVECDPKVKQAKGIVLYSPEKKTKISCSLPFK
ncbi:MAG: hypothetical protein ACXWC9_08955 [Pseudobdellovibrionaceae bacterium]